MSALPPEADHAQELLAAQARRQYACRRDGRDLFAVRVGNDNGVGKIVPGKDSFCHDLANGFQSFGLRSRKVGKVLPFVVLEYLFALPKVQVEMRHWS